MLVMIVDIFWLDKGKIFSFLPMVLAMNRWASKFVSKLLRPKLYSSLNHRILQIWLSASFFYPQNLKDLWEKRLATIILSVE